MLRFFKFIRTKIISKSWMMAALLIGNVLLVAICCACPMYVGAAQQKALQKAMNAYVETYHKPAGALRWKLVSEKDKTVEEIRAFVAESDALMEQIPSACGIDATSAMMGYTIEKAVMQNLQLGKEKPYMLRAFSDMADHATVTEGSSFTDRSDVIEVMISDCTMFKQSLTVGDRMEMTDANGQLKTLEVIGIFHVSDPNDGYWLESPSSMQDSLFVKTEDFTAYFEGLDTDMTVSYSVVLNAAKLTQNSMNRVHRALNRLTADSEIGVTTVFDLLKNQAYDETRSLTTTLWVLQILTLVLLVVFLFMVSGQMTLMEQSEISVYKSRGASKKNIRKMYLLQSILLSACGFVLGIPSAFLICQVIGSANEFLSFVSRKTLKIEWSWQIWVFAAAAAVLSVIVTIVPVIRQSKLDIVAAKRGKLSKKKKKPLWKRLFVDILLMAAGLAVWFINIDKLDKLTEDAINGKPISPLIYAASALFLVGAALFVLRVLPILLKTVFALGKRFWNPAVYAAFLHIIRDGGSQGFLIVFLVLTIASGVYDTTAASTINQNAQGSLFYQSGADIVVKEQWQELENITFDSETGEQGSKIGWIEPDFAKYHQLASDTPEITSMTRVYREEGDTAVVKLTQNVNNVLVMGISTKEFGETLNMDDSVLPASINKYLNALAQVNNGVLVSTNFHELFGIELGDIVQYQTSTKARMTGVVVGFVDYFPTYSPKTTVDGRVMEQYLVVGNFSKFYDLYEQEIGIPYEIWMKIDGSSQFIYDFAAEQNLRYQTFKDYHADVIAQKNEPLFQGTNGVLTIGFMVTLLLCAVGFMMVWILSIRARQLQFGIFRAMGMSSAGVMTMLLCEQFFISGVSIAAGAALGNIAARLFVPFMQLSYASKGQILPLTVVSSGADLGKLFLIVGCVMVICLAVIFVMVRKLKISQALKLGED